MRQRIRSKKIVTALGIMTLIAGALISFESIMAVGMLNARHAAEQVAVRIVKPKKPVTEQHVAETKSPLSATAHDTAVLPERVLADVPFTPQAPRAEWSNPIFQNSCEEAAAIMAVHWVNGAPLSRDDAEKEIRAVTAFEERAYGAPYDLSSDDIARLIKDYFHYDGVVVRHSITVDDIRTELARGNIAIISVNGQKLLNPFYTPPGAVEHTILAIGYDAADDTIITNDPGTRHGEKMRYSAKVIAGALQDYPTGDHMPIATTTTSMVVVSQKNAN